MIHPSSQHADARKRKAIENVIPDCCNIGIMIKSLIAVNCVVLATMLITAPTFQAGVLAFVESSMLIELASLSSLFVLCGLRRAVKTIPPWMQRMVCGLVPAAMTGLIIRYLLTDESFGISLTRVSVMEGVIGAALFGFALQHYFELRTRAFSPALAEARLQALQARIRPHFLFNSLNAVLSLIRTEPKLAETTLEDLADLFRVLMRDTREVTSLENEIRICQQYLSIEKIRLGERMRVDWDMTDIEPDTLRKANLPALLLQPLLENAVHYGVEPSQQTATIHIRISRALDKIEIVIVNPYHADSISMGNHMALTNIRERLTLLYDVEAQLTTSAENGFFEVRLRIPYKRAD